MKRLVKHILASVFLIAIGGFLLAAAMSYNAADASLNTAGGGAVHNWGGAWGAYAADILWQFFGGMGVVLPAALIVWGVLVFAESSWLKLRMYLFAPAVLLGCWLLAQTAWTSRYFPAGAGGYAGYFLKAWWATPRLAILVPLWILDVLLLIFSFKFPVVRTACGIGYGAQASWYGVGCAWDRIRRMRRGPDVAECAPPKRRKPVRKEPVLEAVRKKPVQAGSVFELPPVDLLAAAKPAAAANISKDIIAQNARALEAAMAQFRITGKIVGVNPGPVVTLYEFEPSAGIKTARVIALADDIAREMRAASVRIAVVPGSNTIGIELPNAKRENVSIRELIADDKFQSHAGVLPLVLGKDISGRAVYADLAKMPHLLVAGTTGSGKSVAMNTMILSLLYRWTPAECRMIMVDPKMLELSVYNGIPHLLTPVVTDANKAVMALKWAVREMEDRYRAMSQLGVRNIDGYNQKLAQARQSGQVLKRRVQTGFDAATGAPVIAEQILDLTPMPYIAIFVDEMGDLMLVAGKEVEISVQRLAQMARAAGIHLIMATQRPSVDVITGRIKANFPTRMSFQVRSAFDSNTILGEAGAEQLLGKGDMLYMPGGQRPVRIHGPFVGDDEIERVVHHLIKQGAPQYVETVTEDVETGPLGLPVDDGEGDGDLYDKAVAVVLRDKKPSISYVQRQLRIGYNKAADLVDRMEREGVLSKPNVAGKREILAGDK
ncbi:MAG: DNA translocase FtsK 4TM domain-containing protein [Alphaproteobacteria bacterium]|nr:DNA translocase FtsK 4TM domain-containing protein [Alphaproteobacteria bacterium]